MAKKTRKSRQAPLWNKRTLNKKLLNKKFFLSRRGMTSAVLVLLFVLGLFSSELRDSAAEVLPLHALGIIDPHKPLSSKKKGQLKEGIWKVVNVVDGDTFVVGDEKIRVRLIGADTPETVKPNTPVEPFGPEASAFTKRMIAGANNQVRIAFDGDQVDRYDRNLAMVYIPMPDGTEVWLNKRLIKEGLARAQTQYRFSRGAKDAFRKAEAEAKAARRNIWSTASP